METKEIHKYLLDILSTVDQICTDNDLHYYMIGGTMLGAIRHKGFIPWDDDIDIAMPRSDYERFLLIASNKLPEKYSLYTYQNSQLIINSFAKISNNQTIISYAWTENREEKIGVNIDIFALDGVPTSKYSQNIFFLIYKLFQGIINYKYLNPQKRPLYKKNIAKVIHILYNKDQIFLLKKIDKHIKKYDYSKSSFVANIAGVYGKKEIMPKEYFGHPTLYKFENQYFYGVEKYDEYLKKLYGNYRELPPENKRYSHDYKVNLKTGI